MDDFVVRPLEQGDLDAIEAREPAGQGFVRAMWRLQDAGACTLLVAWVVEEPVGSGQLDWGAHPLELKNLNVRGEYQGRGVGTAIIAAAEALASKHRHLAVGVGVDNHRARALYERLGYGSTGETSTTRYDYVDDHGVVRSATETDVLMIKDL